MTSMKKIREFVLLEKSTPRKKRFLQKVHRWISAFCSNIDLCGCHLHFLRGMTMQVSVITMRMHFFTF